MASASNHHAYRRSFKGGLPVYFDGVNSIDCIKNRLWLVFKNFTGAPIEAQYSIVVRYIDN